ncbi:MULTISPECIES: IS4 family transposase [Flavobacterium]|uniref:IS4 family transposase n=1 Tax=Flavobacterium TaxID=237 RepID=UPI001F17F550|nr:MULTISPECIES: IS4 family transposase [Flavobacterium]
MRRHFTDIEDSRLLRRSNLILDSLFCNSVHSIRQITQNESECKAFYRFLQNNRISESKLIKNMSSNCITSCLDKTVLCIQDTSEVNLYNHKNRIKKDGFIGTTNAAKGGIGFLLHPSFVVDAYNFIPYGFSDVKIWNRPLEKLTKQERNYNKLPIEEKESYKWIESSEKSKEALEKAKKIIIIQDREGDIYEQFAIVPDEKTELLVRARANRTLLNKIKLFDFIANEPLQGKYTIALEGDKRRNISKREATLEVRFSAVTIQKNDLVSKNALDSVDLYIIEAKEIGENIENPICWKLLTTIKVLDLETALQCIDWYTCRWVIEEIFRILKKEGFNIEASELGSAKSIRKLTLMMMETIVKLFLMQIAYDMPEHEIESRSCFTNQELECLEYQIIKLEGKTEKLKNPYKEKDLKRYVWAIARLGGWKGYTSARKPGITTFSIGIQKFASIMQGWQLFQDVSTR